MVTSPVSQLCSAVLGLGVSSRSLCSAMSEPASEHIWTRVFTRVSHSMVWTCSHTFWAFYTAAAWDLPFPTCSPSALPSRWSSESYVLASALCIPAAGSVLGHRVFHGLCLCVILGCPATPRGQSGCYARQCPWDLPWNKLLLPCRTCGGQTVNDGMKET